MHIVIVADCCGANVALVSCAAENSLAAAGICISRCDMLLKTPGLICSSACDILLGSAKLTRVDDAFAHLGVAEGNAGLLHKVAQHLARHLPVGSRPQNQEGVPRALLRGQTAAPTT